MGALLLLLCSEGYWLPCKHASEGYWLPCKHASEGYCVKHASEGYWLLRTHASEDYWLPCKHVLIFPPKATGYCVNMPTVHDFVLLLTRRASHLTNSELIACRLLLAISFFSNISDKSPHFSKLSPLGTTKLSPLAIAEQIDFRF